MSEDVTTRRKRSVQPGELLPRLCARRAAVGAARDRRGREGGLTSRLVGAYSGVAAIQRGRRWDPVAGGVTRLLGVEVRQ